MCVCVLVCMSMCACLYVSTCVYVPVCVSLCGYAFILKGLVCGHAALV